MKKNIFTYEKGINDMPSNWREDNRWNRIVYNKWRSMIERVYSEKYHNKKPTYMNSELCLEWHWLSKFVDDIKKIDGYDEDRFIKGELVLDKDIKSNGKNKMYCLENCVLVSPTENSIQANKTRNNDYLQKGNHHMSKKVCQYDLSGNLIKIWDCAKQISEELDIGYSGLRNCLQEKKKNNEFQGFIWKYLK